MGLEKEMKEPSKDFKRYYKIVIVVKLFLLGVCISGFLLIVKDFISMAIGIGLAFTVFLTIGYRFSRSLKILWEKESANNIDWFLIFLILIITLMLLAVEFIPLTIKPIGISLVAGFTAGVIAAELLFLKNIQQIR
ncbi:MAG: hypothetical protein QXN63_04880 [Candidatus Bathyarchaeia archaeon]